jgi:hypothetical protein
MTIEAITNFITVTDRSGVVQHRYQNGKVGSAISLDGADFYFLSYFYRGAAKNRTGDNLEAELTLASNAVAMNIAHEAVRNKWMVEIKTCSMHPTTWAVGRVITREIWLAASMSYDPEKLTVLLSSGIDAVGASAPTRTLTTAKVGMLPTTGSISNR